MRKAQGGGPPSDQVHRAKERAERKAAAECEWLARLQASIRDNLLFEGVEEEEDLLDDAVCAELEGRAGQCTHLHLKVLLKLTNHPQELEIREELRA